MQRFLNYLFLKTLYMFQAVPPSIIRSKQLHKQLQIQSTNTAAGSRCNDSWIIYFERRSTCFRRFLRPSSGAHNCTNTFRYCQPILQLAADATFLELFISKGAVHVSDGSSAHHQEQITAQTASGTVNQYCSWQQMQRFLNYLFRKTLYMFQTVPPSIIRSTQLYKQLQILSTNTAASSRCNVSWIIYF